ncbi:MAG: tripartite tricarboxylate transporter substrate binding protein [Ramlibacter sp.]|nr:tripartite tricarboxylate transporter substrate binding protein [Ramlibacter sp.]
MQSNLLQSRGRRSLVVALAASAGIGRMAFGQARFPARTFRIVVPWAPGGLVDTGGRIVGDALFRAFEQAAPIENIPGAAGTLGADQVAKAPAAGHTLLMGSSYLAVDVGAGRKMPFDPLTDLAPVALVADTHSVVIVPPGSAIQSLAQLVAEAKARPGALSYGTPGIGSPAHLFVELFSQVAGIQMLHVPYGRTQAINDLLGGRLSVMFSTVPSALAHVRNKQVRPLAVTSSRRLAALPEVPTVAEAGVAGYEASQWLGVFAPAATPRDVVQRLNTELTRAVNSPAVAQTLLARGMEPRTATPEQFSRILAAEVQKWGQVIRTAKIKFE